MFNNIKKFQELKPEISQTTAILRHLGCLILNHDFFLARFHKFTCNVHNIVLPLLPLPSPALPRCGQWPAGKLLV